MRSIVRRNALISLAAAAALVAAAGPATADPGPVDPEPVRDGVIIAGALGGALLLDLLPVRESVAPWNRELFGGLDRRVRGDYSPRAGLLSQAGLATALVVPASFAIGTELDAAAGDRALVYAEALALTLGVAAITKVALARPRPYTYSRDPRAVLKGRDAGRDAYRSFISGHAALAFASVAAGGALHAGRTDNTGHRALVYGAGTFAAAATANWRVRAGKHFYSDVVVGALVGTAIGVGVPALQAGELHAPSGIEWAGIAGGLVLGVASSQLVPLERSRRATETEPGMSLVPIVMKDGAGVGIVGAL